MTSPDGDEPRDIADTQMFRRFVDEDPRAQVETERFWMWKWPGLLVPVISSIVVVVVIVIILLKN